MRYVEDSIAPPAPVLSATDPPSPAMANAPRVIGVAEAGSTVRIYAAATCAGIPVATGSADAFASPAGDDRLMGGSDGDLLVDRGGRDDCAAGPATTSSTRRTTRSPVAGSPIT